MEEQTSKYFMVEKSLSFPVGSAIATDRPTTLKEIETALNDAGTKLKIITEEQYKETLTVSS